MYLLDTDTLIYTLKGHESVIENLAHHQHDTLKISSVSLLELYYGAYKSQRVTSNLANVRRIEASFTVLPVESSLTETFIEGLRLTSWTQT
jgi:predicted nucleic acid-binding protein